MMTNNSAPIALRVQEANQANDFWCNTAYPALRALFVGLGEQYFSGVKILTVGGAFTKKAQTTVDAVRAQLAATMPKNVHICPHARGFGAGSFAQSVLDCTATYTVPDRVHSDGGASVEYVDWYFSLYLTADDFARFKEQPAPVYTPLTVESVEAARNEAKNIVYTMRQLDGQLGNVKEFLGKVGLRA